MHRILTLLAIFVLARAMAHHTKALTYTTECSCEPQDSQTDLLDLAGSAII